MSAHRTSLARYRLVRNVSWASGGQVTRAALQAAYFVAVARALGPAALGQFIAVVAVGALCTPFVGLGSGSVLVREAARDRGRLRDEWNEALLITTGTGLLLSCIAAVVTVGFFFRSLALGTVLLLLASDLLWAQLTSLCAQTHQALDDLRATTIVLNAQSAFRLGAATGLMVCDVRSLNTWAVLYFGATAIVGIGSTLLTAIRYRVGYPRLTSFHLVTDRLDFTAGLVSRAVYTNVDKLTLKMLSTSEIVGWYGAAYRLVSASFLPMNGLLSATYAKFFMSGKHGIKESVKTGVKVCMIGVPYCLCTAAILYLGASYIPLVLGKGFEQSVALVRYLSVLPLIQCIHFIFGDALTGADHQRIRSTIQFLGAGIAIAASLLLIPMAGADGAVLAVLCAEGSVAIMIGVTLGVFSVAESRSALQ